MTTHMTMALAAIVAFALPASALAGPTCSINDLSLTIGTTIYTPTSCATGLNQQGGDDARAASINAQLGTNFAQLASATAGGSGTGTPLNGIQFSVSATTGSSGGWTVSWTDTNGTTLLNLPILIDLDVGLFGGNGGDGYEFTDVTLPASPNTASGTFQIAWQNNGGQTPGLGELELLSGNMREAPSDAVPVKEPASMAMLATGLIAVGCGHRYWRRQRAVRA